MGRTYYATSKSRMDPSVHDRIVHVLATPQGTVVIAMRKPELEERGYAIGVDFTVMQAVKEMLADWDPSEEGPGWVYTGTGYRDTRGKLRGPRGNEQTFDVTILAAFESPPTPVIVAVPDAIVNDETCGECGKRTDDEGDCGECANCRMPLCVHDIPDEQWKQIAARFDTPCDRWKLKADGVTLDAEATHAPRAGFYDAKGGE
jgi:hypothetical protein